MNERINELIQQATNREEFYPAGCNGYPDFITSFNKEMLAELVIKECIKILMQT